MYSYDSYGWLSATKIEGRETDKEPPRETATKKANWTGVEWVLVTYTAPPTPDTRPAQRAAIQSQLDAIDAKSNTPRARREAALGNTAWLASLDVQAATLRTELGRL